MGNDANATLLALLMLAERGQEMSISQTEDQQQTVSLLRTIAQAPLPDISNRNEVARALRRQDADWADALDGPGLETWPTPWTFTRLGDERSAKNSLRNEHGFQRTSLLLG